LLKDISFIKCIRNVKILIPIDHIMEEDSVQRAAKKMAQMWDPSDPVHMKKEGYNILAVAAANLAADTTATKAVTTVAEQAVHGNRTLSQGDRAGCPPFASRWDAVSPVGTDRTNGKPAAQEGTTGWVNTAWPEGSGLAGGRRPGRREAAWPEGGGLAGGRRPGRREAAWPEGGGLADVEDPTGLSSTSTAQMQYS
jgi:hypothetical protein